MTDILRKRQKIMVGRSGIAQVSATLKVTRKRWILQRPKGSSLECIGRGHRTVVTIIRKGGE